MIYSVNIYYLKNYIIWCIKYICIFNIYYIYVYICIVKYTVYIPKHIVIYLRCQQ